MKRLPSFIALVFLSLLFGCKQDKVYPEFITENIIIVVIDGPRYSETWGEPNHSFIPNQSALRHQGVVFDNFWNTGSTYTISGHTAITTGVNQSINNNGGELPSNQSLFQVWRKTHNKDISKAWVITSKDKLEVLANTSKPLWKDKYTPSTNCGVNGAGVGSGYRDDSITLQRCFEIFDHHHPNLVLINFREPDYSGHQGDWLNYLDGISDTDEYVQQIWDYIENDPMYKGKTTLIVTNDHGRHLNTVSGGWHHHGDKCDGCKRIGLLALGPDFPKDIVVSTPYDQTDIARTVAEMLHFDLKNGEGHVITELVD